jgi:hypothetical protein
MNWNKFTKAELISKLNKINKLESKNSNVNNSNTALFSRILDIISYFKRLIFKITLISIIIKTFKRYSLFTKVLRFANWIILTIFGISLIDNFNLDFFKEIRYVLAGIITYLSNTHFYSFMVSLFNHKEVATNQISIREEPMNWESSRNESQIKQDKRNSKISEWLSPESEVKPESDNTKYYVIAGMLIACIAWYYWGDIGPVINNWFRRPRPGNDGTGNNNTGMDRGNIQPSLDNKPTVEQRLKNIFDNKSDQSQIELVDNTQNVASTSKLDNSPPSDNSMNHYFTKPVEQQMTGLRNISGQDFNAESTSVLNEIDSFLKYQDSASFPKNAVIGAGLYKLLSNRLVKLFESNRSEYNQLVQDGEISNKIDRFWDLEDQFNSQPGTPISESNNQTNNLDNTHNILDNQSDTYEEVAVANIESRMAWSDRATPSVHSQVSTPSVQSQDINPIVQTEVIEQPKYTFSDMLDSIRSRRDDSHVLGSPSNKLSSLVDNADNLDDKDLMNSVKETFKEEVGLKVDTSDVNIHRSSQDLPDINIDSNSSSDKSINQFFSKPDVGAEEVKSRFSNLFGQITQNRRDSTSPQISQIGLQPGSPNLSPLNTKPSISNLLDDTAALFDDYDEDVVPISNIDKGKAKEVDENLLSDVINDWDRVETNIQYGDNPADIRVDLKYGQLWTRINSYRFVMNTGQVIDYPYNFEGDVAAKTRSFDLSNKIELNTVENVDIREILILDLNYKGNTVWKNSNYS